MSMLVPQSRDAGGSSLVEEAAAWSGGRCIALTEDVIVLRRSGAAASWPERVREAMDRFRHGQRRAHHVQALP